MAPRGWSVIFRLRIAYSVQVGSVIQRTKNSLAAFSLAMHYVKKTHAPRAGLISFRSFSHIIVLHFQNYNYSSFSNGTKHYGVIKRLRANDYFRNFKCWSFRFHSVSVCLCILEMVDIWDDVATDSFATGRIQIKIPLTLTFSFR